MVGPFRFSVLTDRLIRCEASSESGVFLVNVLTGERHRLTGSMISKAGWTTIDDSESLVFSEQPFFRELNSMGVHACLKLRPYEGIAPHETAYPAATITTTNRSDGTRIRKNTPSGKWIISHPLPRGGQASSTRVSRPSQATVKIDTRPSNNRYI